MMCDNLSLYKDFVPTDPTTNPIHSSSALTTITSPFFPVHQDQQRSYISGKRKLSDYERDCSSINTLEHVSRSVNGNTTDEDDENDDEGEEEDDDDNEDEDDEDSEALGEDPSNRVHSASPMNIMLPSCTIIQRRHSDTTASSYGSSIVKRRCTYSSMYDEEQTRSVLVESYRKLRGVKKPKLQVSLLICNLIKSLERTFTKTPPFRQEQEQEQDYNHVPYYHQSHRTSYRSSSSDSLYMSPITPSLATDEIELTNQQYSSTDLSHYDSDKVLLAVNDLRTSSNPSTTMYHSTVASSSSSSSSSTTTLTTSSSSTTAVGTAAATDNYWLNQSNFAIPVVSTSDDENDVDISFHGGGDYLDLSDNTLSSSFSTSNSSSAINSSSSSSSNDCCCSIPSSNNMTKLLVDTNNNPTDDYYLYHHSTSITNEQTFFYHQNGSNTVDIITRA